MPGMILLEPGNRILEECVSSQIDTKGNREFNVLLCDFDDVTYRIQVEKENSEVLKVSMNLPMYMHTENLGGRAALEKYYGDHIAEPITGYDITLDVKIPEITDKEKTVKALSLIKSNITGGVFDHFFTAVLEDQTPEKFNFSLRSDTEVYFCPRADRCIVVFSVDFMDSVDKVLAKVFLQEFVETRKKLGGAPPVQYGVNPPNELAEFGVTDNQGNLGYISFAILKSHLSGGKKENVIAVLQTFRTFLQYHIKCSKSHFHSKMRNRVRELIKVLNRAKADQPKKDKKTVGGKTFKRN